MNALQQFNPKLHDQLTKQPELVLDLKELILANEVKGDQSAEAESIAAAADALQYKPPKNYSLPFIWAYFAPVFSVTAAALIKLQAATAIPWMSFIILSGVSVRLCILPLMIRQMTLINKVSQASPNIRLAMKLFKHSKLGLHKRVWYLSKAMLDYQRQTNTSLF
jgi:membrane protein insertase Oxa1/YidC/SpoIIIJ